MSDERIRDLARRVAHDPDLAAVLEREYLRSGGLLWGSWFVAGCDERAKGQGIHGVELWLAVRGQLGVASFILYTNWHVKKLREQRRSDDYVLVRANPADVSVCRPATPDEVKKKDDPDMLVHEDCYWLKAPCRRIFTTALGANKVFDALTDGGEDAAFAELEKFYRVHLLGAEGEAFLDFVHYTDHHGGTACSEGPVSDAVKRGEDQALVTCPECKKIKGIADPLRPCECGRPKGTCDDCDALATFFGNDPFDEEIRRTETHTHLCEPCYDSRRHEI